MSANTDTTMATLAAEIKARARDIGFQKVGIVRADALTDERERLEAWLRRGFHGEMPYMEIRNSEQIRRSSFWMHGLSWL